ncbi:MAG: cytochrome C oxidase subunit IV family protein [Bryobacteraceae bacterium]|jgi:cytochrome c oxidase subunit 4
MTQHIDSVKTYAVIWISLLILTGVTTAVAFVDLGPFSVVVALTIAVVKMMLVALFFMHLRHSGKLTQFAMAATVLWLGIMVAFTLADVATRGWMGVPGR